MSWIIPGASYHVHHNSIGNLSGGNKIPTPPHLASSSWCRGAGIYSDRYSRLGSFFYHDRPRLSSHDCRLCIDPPTDLSLVNKTSRYLKSPSRDRISSPIWRVQCILFWPWSQIRRWWFSPYYPFILNCEPLWWELKKIVAWWSLQNHIICKIEKCNNEPTKPNPLNALATPRNYIYKCYEQNPRQRIALFLETNLTFGPNWPNSHQCPHLTVTV